MTGGGRCSQGPPPEARRANERPRGDSAAGALSQMPRALAWADDPWGISWRLVQLARRVSLRRTARFLHAWILPQRHERPVFIVGVPRSGTTLLFHLLRESTSLGALPREGHDLWRTFHHPRAGGWRSDRVGPGEVRRAERRFVDAYLAAHFRQRRFVDKTPENSLRILYLLELFPDASFVVVRRNPCDVIESLIRGWLDPDGRFRSYFVPQDLSIPGYPHRRRWCFALIEGWRQLVTSPIPEIALRQWADLTEALWQARSRVPRERWVEVHLERLLAAPAAALERLLASLDLPPEDALEQRLVELVARPVNALSAPGVHKWRQGPDPAAIEALLPRIAEVAPRGGYRVSPQDGSFEIIPLPPQEENA